MTDVAQGGEDKGLSVKERLEARKRQEAASGKPTRTAKKHNFLQSSRSLIDALVLAYMIAMFIRSFVFELFMIPTGSMTPTLIGDRAGDVAFADYDKDGIEDVIYTRPGSTMLQICLVGPDESYKELLFVDGVRYSTVEELRRASKRRKDMILVNKFAYWFTVPKRGDIAVFKVPDRPSDQNASGSIFDPQTPVYIKRVVGLPGETVTIQGADITPLPLGHANRRGSMFGGTEYVLKGRPMLINGEPLVDPLMDTIVHFPPPGPGSPLLSPRRPDNIQVVGPDGVLMVGDNSTSSLDGRFWGDVPRSHMRGQAVLRYLPIGTWRFF